jgi:hypothetical protein
MSGALYCATGNENSAPTEKRTASAPRYIVAQGREPFSLVRFGVVLWRGLTHLRTHREVLRLLLRVPPFAEIVQKKPRFAYKYLTDDYLARGLSVSESAACFMHHYKRLHELLPDCLLRQILQEEVTLHVIPEGAIDLPRRWACLARTTTKANSLSVCEWTGILFLFSLSPLFLDRWLNQRLRRLF